MKQPLLLRFLFWVVLFATVWPSWAQTTCGPVAGLVARFPFDEGQGTAPQDATGQVGAGTLMGGSWQPGGGHDGGGALALAGADHLSLPLNWQPTAFSFSFWVKPTRLFDWSQGAGGDWGSFLFHSTHDGAIYVGTDVPTRLYLPNQNLVELGVWQQFVFTFDHGVGTLYKNGQQLASRTGMALPGPWRGIGLNGDALYDELRVYDRAVSPQEAHDLYNCPPTPCPPVRIQVSPNVTLTRGQATTLQASGTQVRNALGFDGVDDVVQVSEANAPAGSTSPLFAATNTFTVEAWVKPSATHEVDAQSNSTTDGTSGQRYLVFPTHGGGWGDGHAGMGISMGTNGVSVYEHAGGYMPAVLVWQGNLTAWTHIAVVYQDRLPSLYINGLLVAVGQRGGVASVHPSLGFGGGPYGYFQGGVGEVRIWSTARTKDQVQQSQLAGADANDPALVGDWRLDEGQGNVAADQSARRHNGQLTLSGKSDNYGNYTPPPTASGPVWLTASPNAAPLSWRWSPATGLSAAVGATVTAAPTQTTIYSVTADNGDDCLTTQATVTVTVPQSNCATVPLTTSPAQTIALGNTAALSARGTFAGNALTFNGVKNQLLLPSPGLAATSLSTTLVNTFTIEGWVQPIATHEIDAQGNTDTGGTSGQRYLIFPTNGGGWGDGHAGMGISVGTNGVSVYEHAGGYMPAVLVWQGNLTAWTHIAVVYQDRLPSLYINGLLAARGVASAKAYVHPSHEIGGGYYGYFAGSLNELRIWSTARTADQIQANYQGSLAGDEAGLAGCWHLDEGAGSVAHDATAGGRDGELATNGYWDEQGWRVSAQWQVPSTAPPLSPVFRWSPAASLDRSVGPTVAASPAVTTTYTVSAVSGSGCAPSQAAVTVTVNAPFAAVLPPDVPADNRERNWTLERSFDGNGHVIAESKQFTDALGRPTQAQARNAATQQVFAAQTVYSTGGQPVLQTLAAPINNQSFNYQENFVTAGGKPYGPGNFEDGKASQPDAVDAGPIGTLGHYFSQLNETEPLTPITSYPYSLVEPYEGPLGGTKRAAGPGDELRMGQGREGKGRDFVLCKEFDHYVQLRPQFVPGSPLATLAYQGLKSVSVNADGRESIVVTNKEGQALVSCLSGPQYPGVPVTGFLSTDPANPSDPNAPVYQDIHVPAAGPQEVTFTAAPGQPGGSVRVVDLLTDAAQDYPVAAPDTRVTLAPGFYRFISLGGTQQFSYLARYGNFSYTYYDAAGRVVATVAPNGLTPPASTASTGPGPVGYWALHEDSGSIASDGSGNRLTGTLQNQPVWDVNGPPTGGGSLRFDGQTSYVLVGDQPALRMSTTLSMEAWIYPTGNASGVIINKENEYEVARFPDGSIQWAFQNTAPGWAWVNTGIIAPLNQWSRVGISYDNGKVRAYLNGAQVGTTYNGAGAIGYSGFDFRIGGRASAAQFFQGNLAEVRVWNTVYPAVSTPDPTAAGDVHFITRNTYDTSGRLLATESNDEGRTEYAYARDGRIRFSQSALQRPNNRFSYSNYDAVGRVVESGEGGPFKSALYPGWEAETNAVAAAGCCIAYLNNVGNYAQFTVQVPQAGAYALAFNYAAGASNRYMTLLMNGAVVEQEFFPQTDNGQWGVYALKTVTASLRAGTNTVRLEYRPGDTGAINVASLQLTQQGQASLASLSGLLEDRTPTGGLDVNACSQRNRVWYDLPWDGAPGNPAQDHQIDGRTQEFVLGAVAKTQNDQATTWYSYDELGRVTWVVQDIQGVGVKTLDYTYDFSGNVLQVAYQTGQADSFYHYYGYDAAQRLVRVETSPDGTARTLQAAYSYYLHGPLKRVQVAGDLQGVDYVYTLQGALKSLNHTTTALEPGQDGPATNGVYKDLFALTLEYFSGDYRSRNIDVPAPPLPPGPGAPVAARYDGTIRSASWRTAARPDIQRMAYAYDEKSQLQDATYSNWQLVNKAYQLNAASTNSFQEGGLSYDPNGNLQALRRTDQAGNVADNFRYTYKANTNQLAAVHTGSPDGPTVLDYDYDALGQMTRQKDEQGQRYLAYDVTGKTTGVYLDAAHQQPLVTFAYDDRGFRVRKTAYPAGGGPATATAYVRDVAGNVLTTYTQAAPGGPWQRTEVPLYGASRLGTLTHLDDASPAGTDDYRYELTDHLGNARVVFHRPTTRVDVETMELGGVPVRATFLNDDRYRVAVSGAPSGDYVARLTDAQPEGQELKRVLAVTRGDTVTFSALAQWKQNAAATGSGPTPFVLAGAAAGLGALSQRGAEGQATTYPTSAPNWLSQLAAGLGFTLGRGNAPTSLGATSLAGWIKYRVLDAQGNPMRDAQGQPLAGVDYLFGTGQWEYLQTGVRVPEDGIMEVTAGTSGTGEAVYFDNLRVEQTGSLIVQEQHQYAFGAPLPGLSYTVGNKRYRHGYQGQYAEHDVETGWENFELRLYNSRVGRWLSYDPVGQFSSPYIGMGNNPVSGVDPDGGWSGPHPPKFRALSNALHVGASGSDAFSTILKGARIVTRGISAYSSASNSRGAASDATRVRSFSQTRPPYQSRLLGLLERKELEAKQAYAYGQWLKTGTAEPSYLLEGLFIPAFAGARATSLSVRAAEAATTFEGRLARRGVLGVTTHAADQMAARGFSEESILKIIREGNVEATVYKGQAQVHYILGRYKIATAVYGQNSGKIITIMGDYNVIGVDGTRGMFTGF